jgi:hypothetical protein
MIKRLTNCSQRRTIFPLAAIATAEFEHAK